jgi:hypothetical protein
VQTSRVILGCIRLHQCPHERTSPTDETPAKKKVQRKDRERVLVQPLTSDDAWNEIEEVRHTTRETRKRREQMRIGPALQSQRVHNASPQQETCREKLACHFSPTTRNA